VDAVGAHHENFDGSGYPFHLSGDEVPLVARIVAVADSFEVMTAVRSYKRPMTAQAARAELVRKSGTQFDPRVVRAFLNVPLGRLHWALGLVAWVAEIPFLTVIPRAAAQVSAVAGGGTVLSTSALSSIATASLGAMVAAGPTIAHAGATLSASSSPTVSVPVQSGRASSTAESHSTAGGASSNASDPNSLTQVANPPSAPVDPAPQASSVSTAGNVNSSASPSIDSTSPSADAGNVSAVAENAKASAIAQPGGVLTATAQAGGNGDGAANSNAGDNGNGATSSNAGGNGNGATHSEAGDSKGVVATSIP